jgi:SecD/SecF fusion protein
MPGIAGIVLTVGMAVDANVLIFERVREELKQGKSTLAAILAGYDRAFLAIFDSNLTTFLTAIILFIFGSGPIRGFAITLSAGIIVSMYTALVVTRMILRLCTKETSKAPKIMDWFHFPNLDFVGMGRLAMTISAVIIVVTLGIFAVRCKTQPREVLAIDFTGGTVMSYTFENEPAIADMRIALKAGGIDDAIIQSQKSADGTTDSIQVESGYDKIDGSVEIGKAITDTLKKAFPESGIQEIGQDTIGSQIGDDLKRDATKAVIIALIGMLIYISIRFEFGFALGAVVALLHDVLITLGLFTLFGRQIGVTAIACFLTIVGYSVNDTIVISDRIREDLKKNKDLSFRDLCNRSIVTTLGRTVLTSLTTLLAVLSLLIFGGGAIFDFALCMTIGVIAGVYSTIFIATPVMLAWYKGRRPGMAKKDA